jgi:hypothetical protein
MSHKSRVACHNTGAQFQLLSNFYPSIPRPSTQIECAFHRHVLTAQRKGFMSLESPFKAHKATEPSMNTRCEASQRTMQAHPTTSRHIQLAYNSANNVKELTSRSNSYFLKIGRCRPGVPDEIPLVKGTVLADVELLKCLYVNCVTQHDDGTMSYAQIPSMRFLSKSKPPHKTSPLDQDSQSLQDISAMRRMSYQTSVSSK